MEVSHGSVSLLLMEILVEKLSIKGYIEGTLLSVLHTFLRSFGVVINPSLKERQHDIWTLPRLWEQIDSGFNWGSTV